LKYVRYGTTGIKVSQLCFGFGIPGSV
jgi:aryl-alcohol dehydrogenase-like predicted oxidoreductase